MVDIFSKEKRSEIMKSIHGRDTKPELIVRRFLFSKGLRYRIHQDNLPGKPDIVLKRYNTIVFVHGCFFHGHRHCKLSKIPKSNIDYWTNKIKNNIDRDKKSRKFLQDSGWRVITIWECKVIQRTRERTLNNLYKRITG